MKYKKMPGGVSHKDPSVPTPTSDAGKRRLSLFKNRRSRGRGIVPYEEIGRVRFGSKISQANVQEAIERLKADPKVSYCGIKLDLATQMVRHDPNGKEVPCSRLSLIGIGRSPGAFHQYTTETYRIEDGTGWFLKRKRGQKEWKKTRYKPGDIFFIEPGNEHAIASDDLKKGTLVTLAFDPPLAWRVDPRTKKNIPYRDEYMTENEATIGKIITEVGGQRVKAKRRVEIKK